MDKQRQIKLIQELADIIQELEWVIAVPADDSPCEGLIVGTPEYVAEIVQVYYGETKTEVDVFAPNTESGDKIPDKDPSEDENYH